MLEAAAEKKGESYVSTPSKTPRNEGLAKREQHGLVDSLLKDRTGHSRPSMSWGKDRSRGSLESGVSPVPMRSLSEIVSEKIRPESMGSTTSGGGVEAPIGTTLRDRLVETEVNARNGVVRFIWCLMQGLVKTLKEKIADKDTEQQLTLAQVEQGVLYVFFGWCGESEIEAGDGHAGGA